MRRDVPRGRPGRRAAATALAFVIVMLVAAAASLSTAATARKTTGTSWVSVVTQEGGDIIVGGYFRDSALGTGAVTYKLRLGTGQPGTVTVTAREVTAYTRKGSLRGTGSATMTTNADGSSTLTNGKLKLTKGTGALKGHRYTASFTGSSPADSNVITFNLKGVYR